MILTALNRYYDRLAEQDGKVSLYGFSDEKISFAIVLSPLGEVVAVEDLRTTEGKKRLPCMMSVPRPEKRTVGIKSNFLWDKTAYVLGVTQEATERTAREHTAFKEFNLNAISDSKDAGLQALAIFLRQWKPEQLQNELFPTDLIDNNVVFRLDGGGYQYLHQRPAAQELWRTLLQSGSDGVANSQCLVSGNVAPIARLHPSIKNVDGGQSSGAAIVSFNLDAFTSYGKEQGANAQISEHVAFTYTTALNYLLRRNENNKQRIKIGDATVVFWAEAPDAQQAEESEAFFGAAINPSDDVLTAQLAPLMQQIAQGRPLKELRPDWDTDNIRFYVLGLAPNAARISIRFWQVDTLESFARHLAQHYHDVWIEPKPWKTSPAIWRLLYETAAQGKAENIPPQLAGELTRAVLTGGLYPQSLLNIIIMRMRADHEVNGIRAAICKACINRALRRKNTNEKEISMSLDITETNAAYRLGRLFAVLEGIQRAALGGDVNATIRDRYYGAASATPASIFPLLLKNTMNHLSKIRKDKKGLAINLEKELGEIVDGVGTTFPRNLRLEEQGRFAIGYYHQQQQRFHGKTSEVEQTITDTEGN